MYTLQRFSALALGALLACAAGAQQPPGDEGAPDEPSYAAAPAPDQTDPPARVARLAYLTGNVSFTPAGESDWVQAQLNRPVVTGDKLWTADGAHAELQLGSTVVELGDQSSFDFLNLDDQLAQMELTQGELKLDVRRLRGNESYEVDTPTIAFVASRVGDYRIDVDPQGATTVTARRGGGDAVGEGGKRVAIAEGQSVRFNDSQLNDYQVNQIGAPDAFDRYAQLREQRYAQAQPRGYVSEDVTGYEDLDQYGAWDDSPEYGHVWYPSDVAEDWAPYHSGQWEWIDPWGWSWVDEAPWGFAPFHYGRWAYINSRWGWVPGPVDVEPVYAPALVAFVGGGGFGIDISVGGPIGWFALGPRDVYFPGYRCGHDYFARVNIGNAYISRSVVNNYYGDWSRGRVDYTRMRFANRDAPRAITAVNRDVFVGGRPVAAAAIAVNRSNLTNAHILARPAVVPTRDSLFAGRTRAGAPPASAINRTVVAAHQPAPPRPSFAQRQPLLQRNGGQPLSVTQLHALGTRSGANARGGAGVAANNVRVIANGRGVAGRANGQRAINGPVAQPGTTAAQMPQRPIGSANARRNVAGSPSRAPEMNRSPARANAQYLRSAGFAHQGVVPGSERATSARGPQNVRSANGRRAEYAGAAQTARGAGSARGPSAIAQGHVPSAAYARGPNRGNAIEGNANRSAQFTQQRSNRGAYARGNPPTHATVAAPSPSERAVTRRASTATSHVPSTTYASPSSRAITARERTRSADFASPSRNNSGNRGPDYRSNARVAPSPQYRAPEHARVETRQSYAQPAQRAAPQQYRAPVRTQSAQSSRPSYVQQARPSPQVREAPHAQAPAYSPPQRPTPTRTASAKQSAPRGREPPRNEKDKDKGG